MNQSIAKVRPHPHFESRLPVDNANGPTTLDLAIRAVRFDAQADQDVIATASGQVAVPAANETLDVAGKGGLAADSMLVYEWDIEDRLVAVETASGAPGTVRKRLEFAYDYQGRRAVRKTYIWNSGTATWDLDEDRRYVYDGWNLVAEFNQQSTISNLKCSYLWGLDLAGLRDGQPGQEAGGIGGLVAMSDWTSGSRTASHYTVADGNGNIVALVDADSAAGAIETVDYDPFGNVLARRQTAAGVSGASLCPFGFSSKYLDADTGLLYFGYRYYSPDLGRWLARDPLQEQGGANLYAYCNNDPVNAVDPLGLDVRADKPIRVGNMYYVHLYDHGWFGSQTYVTTFSYPASATNPMIVAQDAELDEHFAKQDAWRETVLGNLRIVSVNLKIGAQVVELGLRVGSDPLDNLASLGELAEDPGDWRNRAAILPLVPGGLKKLDDLADSGKMGEKATEAYRKARKKVEATCPTSKLPRFDGPKPSYVENPAHKPGFPGWNANKTPLPADAENVFKNAVPNDPKTPTAWFGLNANGQIYRFSLGNDGTAHFSGIDGVGDGVRNLTRYAVDRLQGL